MSVKRSAREKPDFQIEIPTRFARSLSVYAKSYQSTMSFHIMHRTKTLALFLRSLNKTSYCQFAVGLASDECCIRYFTNEHDDDEETKLDFSAEEAVRTMTMLRSSGDVLRLGVKSTWPYVLLEAGSYVTHSKKGVDPGAKAGKKRAAADDAAEKKVWSSCTDVQLARITDATAEMVIKAKPADRFVIRIDQNYLLRCLTKHKRSTRDKQVVEIWFETETRHITHEMSVDVVEDEDDGSDEDMRQLRMELGGGGGQTLSSTLKHTVLVPTKLKLTFTAPGTSTVSTETFDIVDRRKEWNAGTVASKSVQSGIGWREDNPEDEDAAQAVEKRKDSELGIDSYDSRVAELFAFPAALERSPASFRYSSENLIRQLNSAVFSRYATLQWSDTDRTPGNLWMCSTLDVGEGKITGLCAAYQVD